MKDKTPEEVLTKQKRKAARRRLVRAAIGAIWRCGPKTLLALADGKLTPAEISDILTCLGRSLLKRGEGDCECQGGGEVQITVTITPVSSPQVN